MISAPFPFSKPSTWASSSLWVRIILGPCLLLLPYTSTFAATSPKSPSKLALLVGITEYAKSGLRPLKGCVNDVYLMRDLLISKYGFAEQDILILTNTDATHADIVQAFKRHLISKANQETITLFYFSGHGSQEIDESGDETDDRDETLVAYDSRFPGQTDITDDELNGLFHQLAKKTAHITCILDACNSGTGNRDKSIYPYPKQAPPRDQLSLIPGNGQVDLFGHPEFAYTLLSAGAASEYAFELEAEGKHYGALTWFLAKSLSGQSRQVTWETATVPVKNAVTQKYPLQHPQLEGEQTNRYVFSDSTPPYFSRPKPVTGELHIRFSGTGSGQDKSRLHEESSPIQKAVLALPYVQEVSLTSFAHLELNRIENSVTLIHPDHPSHPVWTGSSTSPTVTQELKTELRKWARWFEILALTDSGTATPVAFRLSGGQHCIAPKPNGSSNEPNGVSRYLPMTYQVFKPGQSIPLVLGNRSTEELYLHVVGLNTTSGAINVLFPKVRGRKESVRPGRVWNRWKLDAWLPKGKTFGCDVLLLIATPDPDIDFRGLKQDANGRLVDSGSDGPDNVDWDRCWVVKRVVVVEE